MTGKKLLSGALAKTHRKLTREEQLSDFGGQHSTCSICEWYFNFFVTPSPASIETAPILLNNCIGVKFDR